MISVVVPVYCGSKTLPELVRRISHVLERVYKDQNYEIILVDDHSPDNSFEVISDLAVKYEHVFGIQLSKNFGQQNATYCGLHYSKGEVVVTIDDDLQHEPELIPSLVRKLSGDVDLVYGVFVERHDGEHRKMGSKLTAEFFKRNYPVLSGKRVSSFRVISGALRDDVREKETGFVYLSCLLLNECTGVDNVLIPFTPRAEGRSNYNLSRLLKLFLKLHVNYGMLGPVYKRLLKTKTPSFEVNRIVRNADRSVNTDESHDAGWRHQSAVCN